jgi:alpha-beta hydrolase superfamily lysophospholipase
VVGDLHLPDHWDGEPLVLACCLPGGGMSRRYFDLQVPEAAGNYSMARHLARAGFAVANIDHPGVGESDRPHDGYALMPRTIADVDAFAIAQIRARLTNGT